MLSPNSYGIFVTSDYDWNSSYSYYLKKKILSVTAQDIHSDNISKWQKRGYSFLIIYDEKKILAWFRKMGKSDQSDILNKFPIRYHKNNIIVYSI